MSLHPHLHPLRGKGMFVWEGQANDAEQLANALRRHGFRWLAIKAHEGTSVFQPWEVRRYAGACRAHGLELLLWGYLKAEHPEAEANLAAALVHRHGAAGYIADAEVEYERAPAGSSERFAFSLSRAHPRIALALSSFGRVDMHPGIDWRAWLGNRFAFMPQAYECESPELRPSLCVERAAEIWPRSMILPTLGAYQGVRGRRTGAQLRESLAGLKLEGVSVWSAQTTTAEQLTQLGRI